MQYQPFSHHAEESSIDELIDLLIEHTVFFAFSEKEVLKYHGCGKLDDLKKAANYAYARKRISRKAKGTAGEVLLDLLIQLVEPGSRKFFTRLRYRDLGEVDPKGYDAAVFSTQEGKISLWLGQAKSNLRLDESKDELLNDLKKNTKKYFVNYLFYVADEKDSTFCEIIDKLNQISEDAEIEGWTDEKKFDEVQNVLRQHKVTIRFPCLMTFSHNCYKETNLGKSIEKVRDSVVNFFDEKDLDIEVDYELLPIYIFPVTDIERLRESVVKK